MGIPPVENIPPEKEGRRPKLKAMRDMLSLFKDNIGDTVAYLLLAISLLYCFFNSFVGGIPVGFIMGIYFSTHVFRLATQFREFLVTDGIFRGFIIIAAIAALIITAPGLSLGLFLGTFTRPFFSNSKEEKQKPSEQKQGEQK